MKTRKPKQQIDLSFENHFPLFLIRPLSELGQKWLHDNVGSIETQHFGNAVVCESRYVQPIWEGAIRDGLEVRG